MFRHRLWLIMGVSFLLAGIVTAVAANTHTPQPEIIYFQAEPTAAYPGEIVTLSWEVQNASRVDLARYWDQWGASQRWDDLPLTHTHPFTIPTSERQPFSFILYVYDAEDQISLTGELVVHILCPDVWFFAPSPGDCPSPPLYSPAIEQDFEGGHMIWRELHNQILTLFFDYPPVDSFTNEWDGGEICDLGPPPAGRIHPVGRLGKLWCENATVRERLGWALSPEKSYETITQYTTMSVYSHEYFRAASGHVWHLFPLYSDWEKITLSGQTLYIPFVPYGD
jgi:hypothetical protein